MNNILLNTDKYLLPSTAGMFHLACQPGETVASRWFSKLLQREAASKMTLDEIQTTMGVSKEADFINQLNLITSLGWIDEHDEAIIAPQNSLEEMLPQLLPALSTQETALLADSHGFCIGFCGFNYADSEALAVMTADFTDLYSKYGAAIRKHVTVPTQAWAMIDAAGHSQLGTWPIFLGYENFSLLIQGTPRLNHPNFGTLIWALYNRYAI